MKKKGFLGYRQYVIAAGCKHTVEAITALDMIEVQLGDEISVADKIKFPMV